MSIVKQYHAKILMTHSNGAPANVAVLRTFAMSEDAAELDIDRLVESWNDVAAYWILKISEKPILLIMYQVKVLFTYQHKTKATSFRIKLENMEEAAEIFKYITGEWPNVKDFQIMTVNKI